MHRRGCDLNALGVDWWIRRGGRRGFIPYDFICTVLMGTSTSPPSSSSTLEATTTASSPSPSSTVSLVNSDFIFISLPLSRFR